MDQSIAIIGAGITGVATALELTRAGLRPVLFDPKGPAGGASEGNGGILAASAVVPVTTPGLLRTAPRMLLDPDAPLFVRWRHLPRMAGWLMRYLRHANAADCTRIAAGLAPLISDTVADHQALAEGTAAAAHIVPSDYLYLYKDRAAFEADRFGWDLRRAQGYCWSEEPARPPLPGLSPDDYGFALRLPGHGRINDPGAYVRALWAAAEARGAVLRQEAVEQVVIENGRARSLVVAGQQEPFAQIAVTSGAWSGRLLGRSVPVEPERGYHLELWDANWMPEIPLMFTAHKFVATPMNGRLRLAGIVEFGGLDAGPSDAPFDLLLRKARAAIPGLDAAKITRWMGHRPATPDSLPLLGPLPQADNLLIGTGLHHVGLTGGPKMGRILAQLLRGVKPNLDLTPYDPARFGQ